MLTVTSPDGIACQQECLSRSYMDTMNCWALDYNTTSNDCALYFTNDPLYFVGVTGAGPPTFAIKQCYSGMYCYLYNRHCTGILILWH